ncbi:MAG: putative sulfate exporter family transporter [Bacteroidota bacterium]|nr:putative sulfate exporter family transporter [Bacteroidota bacterium]MDX5428429.1 putative sulfate exporter family transporter [Bacteroidota bacterium]MDX5506196.1 putative sulfate exporter family transporter [Bacteroidota bacterium]
MIGPYLWLTLLSAAAYLIGQWTGFSSVFWGLILGAVMANIIGELNAPWKTAIRFGEKKVLGWAIILMGLGVQWHRLYEISPWIIVGILILLPLLVLGGTWMGKRWGGRTQCGMLIGFGHAICGNSAIAAAAPVVGAEAREVGLSIAVINILGTVGLVVVPLLGIPLGLTEIQSGILAGSSLQAVGHAIAAGMAISPTAGHLATVVKMGRVALLGPGLLILGWAKNRERKDEKLPRQKLPFFIYGFILAFILGNLFPLPEIILDGASKLENLFLIFAMTAIGMNIRFRDLKTSGPRALLIGIFVFSFQILFILGLLKLFS